MSMPGLGVRTAWRRGAVLLACWLGIACFAGLLTGAVLLCVFAAISLYLAMQLVYAYQLHRWLSSDRIEPSEGIGVWQEIFLELYRLKQRNRKRKKRLNSIVQEFQASTAALPDGAVVLDARGRIVWFNQAAATLLALRSPQDIGQRIANLLRTPGFSDYIGRRPSEIGEMEMPSPSSDAANILLRLIPYGNDQRLLIARDISEQRRLEATRKDFVANASHELRTPLTVLRGYLEMMQEESGEDGALSRWQSPIREMSGQARRMNGIIESLLKLAQLESEGLHQKQASVDMPGLIRTLVNDADQADRKGHEVSFDIDDELALFGRASELESVVSNLIQNAVQYTPGNRRIEVRWWQDEQGAYFSVTDSGMGIEAAHIPRLTERFYRVDPGRDSASGGTGLGLAIVRHCLDHHDATLTIASEPDTGSVFTCQFPRQRALAWRAAVNV